MYLALLCHSPLWMRHPYIPASSSVHIWVMQVRWPCALYRLQRPAHATVERLGQPPRQPLAAGPKTRRCEFSLPPARPHRAACPALVLSHSDASRPTSVLASIDLRSQLARRGAELAFRKTQTAMRCRRSTGSASVRIGGPCPRRYNCGGRVLDATRRLTDHPQPASLAILEDDCWPRIMIKSCPEHCVWRSRAGVCVGGGSELSARENVSIVARSLDK